MDFKELQEQRIAQSFSTLTQLTAPCVGYVDGTGRNGEILVHTDKTSPQKARLLANVDRTELIGPDALGREVLLVFDHGDPNRPIIIGFLEHPLEKLVSLELESEEAKKKKDIAIDGKRVTIEAEEEVLLRCGKGSILIRKDGKIVIKGTNILSRSSGPNRVKGASVGLN